MVTPERQGLTKRRTKQPSGRGCAECFPCRVASRLLTAVVERMFFTARISSPLTAGLGRYFTMLDSRYDESTTALIEDIVRQERPVRLPWTHCL